MILLFLENGYKLSSLSRSQMKVLEKAFTLYLLHAIKFNDALQLCYNALDDDQEHMKTIIKDKMAEMIEDADCNQFYKPALLRLAAKDDSIFRKNDIPQASTLRIFEQHAALIKERIKAVEYPLNVIGPQHIRRLEQEHLSKDGEALKPMETHARNYVFHYARYLTQGDSGFSANDMISNLKIVGLRTLRWYYPFLSGLHMLNTMRRSITNRGRGMLTAATVESRCRMIQLSNGRTVNLESTANFDKAIDWAGFAEDPTARIESNMTLVSLMNDHSIESKILCIILDEGTRNAFLSWMQKRYDLAEADLAEAVSKTGKSYVYLLSKYFKMDIDDVKKAMRRFRRTDILQSIKEATQVP